MIPGVLADLGGVWVRLDRIEAMVGSVADPGWTRIHLSSGGSVRVKGCPNEIADRVEEFMRQLEGL